MYLSQFGTRGSGAGQFYAPWAIDMDAAANVYVTDRVNERVTKYTAAGSYLSTFGSGGFGQGQFNSPTGIAVNSGGIYVQDLNNSRVQRFTAGGAFTSEWGTFGTGNGQFYSAYDVAVGPDGDVWVADGNNYRVQRFTSAGVFKSLQAATGGPRGIALDAAGNVYVAEVVTDQARRLGGAFVVGGFNNPYGIAVDSAGLVYVCDKDNHRVQVFSASGLFLVGWGSYGTGDGQFNHPTGVAIHPTNGQVYVVDNGNNRVQVFSAVGAPAPAPSPTFSTVPPVFVCPYGDGAYQVTIRDDTPAHAPMSGKTVLVHMVWTAGALYWCDAFGGTTRDLTAVTNASGIATFNPAVGGCVLASGSLGAVISVDGVAMHAGTKPVISPDFAGDGNVGLIDATTLTKVVGQGLYDWRMDVDGDGTVGVADAQRFTVHIAQGHRC